MPDDDADALPRPDAILFDLDGTLVDSVGTRIDAWLQALDQSGFPTTSDQLAPMIGLDGRRLAREVAAVAGRPIDEARSEEIDKLSGEIYERINRPRPLPGVADVVAAWSPSAAQEPQPLERGTVPGGPVREQIVDDRVQLLLWGIPRLQQVLVELDLVDRPDCDVSVGVGRQQDALGVGLERERFGEELGACH